MRVTVLHHTSHITADAAANNAFYTHVLGMRRTWKTVNFDDPRVYHLAYADRLMSPGTVLTFFEHPGIRADQPGVRSIAETALRVRSADDLAWWADRLAGAGAEVERELSRGDRPAIRFADPEGLDLWLVADGGAPSPALVWDGSPVPPGRQLRGLDSVTLEVPERAATESILRSVLGMAKVGETIYGVDGGGPGREVHVRGSASGVRHRLGAGGTHHVAFHAASLDDVDRYAEAFRRRGVRTSGVIDRTFSHNLYFREPGGTLFEIIAEVPGRTPYASDDEIGHKLVLPDHLEPQRQEIERRLRPIPEVSFAPAPGRR
jgi:glyoxalase family protein